MEVIINMTYNVTLRNFINSSNYIDVDSNNNSHFGQKKKEIKSLFYEDVLHALKQHIKGWRKLPHESESTEFMVKYTKVNNNNTTVRSACDYIFKFYCLRSPKTSFSCPAKKDPRALHVVLLSHLQAVCMEGS